ncbi:VWA domain-containing protein [Anabaena sp. UHCC 0187]|uniref:VWA domain-containing protein n=1 Tax=Anabaena sp. UHCC 0187 TaxID=2590018 RepID=UPI001447EF2A|nr:VWA domain-containing protein [Anabaena sp. UHCC 0187]MTJ14375.1 VWA domain-containing protein [Anabaena sp. UHCC 0187]
MGFANLKQYCQHILYQSIATVTLVLISCIYPTFAQTTPKGGIDWIVVVDTSASMRGVGGTKNIFTQVKNSITDFVNTARVGDTVTLYTFDRDVQLKTQNIAITKNEDRGKLKQMINALQANGMRTHTGKAVQAALTHSAKLNQRGDALGRTVSIVFLTDGLEDVRGIPNPVTIPSNTQLLQQQKCKPYVFFVSLGLKEHEKQLNNFANNPALCKKGRVLRDPGGAKLNQLAQSIRPILIKPQLDVDVPINNTQPISPGSTTQPFNINGMSNVNAKVKVKLEDPNQSGISLIKPNQEINLGANQPTAIPIQLKIPANAKGGTENIRLVLTSTDKAISPIPIELPVTIKWLIDVQPKSLDFGSVEAGQTTNSQTLVVNSNQSGTANLQFPDNPQDVSLGTSTKAISLTRGENKIPIQLQVSDNSSDGKKTLTLVFTPDNSLVNPINTEVNLDVLMPLSRKIIIWSLLFLLLLLIVLIVVCLIQRKTPWELVQDIRNRNHLEGELEIIAPLPTSPEDQFISLTQLQTNKVTLSKLISAISTIDSDAELTTTRQLGKKKVYLNLIKGKIIINNEEITTTELYDQDTIKIGNIKLRYYWHGNQRPFEQNTGEYKF